MNTRQPPHATIIISVPTEELVAAKTNVNAHPGLLESKFCVFASISYAYILLTPFFHSHCEVDVTIALSLANDDDVSVAPVYDSTNSGDDGLGGGVIAGIVLGSLAGVVLMAGIVSMVLRSGSGKEEPSEIVDRDTHAEDNTTSADSREII